MDMSGNQTSLKGGPVIKWRHNLRKKTGLVEAHPASVGTLKEETKVASGVVGNQDSFRIKAARPGLASCGAGTCCRGSSSMSRFRDEEALQTLNSRGKIRVQEEMGNLSGVFNRYKDGVCSAIDGGGLAEAEPDLMSRIQYISQTQAKEGDKVLGLQEEMVAVKKRMNQLAMGRSEALETHLRDVDDDISAIVDKLNDLAGTMDECRQEIWCKAEKKRVRALEKLMAKLKDEFDELGAVVAELSIRKNSEEGRVRETQCTKCGKDKEKPESQAASEAEVNALRKELNELREALGQKVDVAKFEEVTDRLRKTKLDKPMVEGSDSGEPAVVGKDISDGHQVSKDGLQADIQTITTKLNDQEHKPSVVLASMEQSHAREAVKAGSMRLEGGSARKAYDERVKTDLPASDSPTGETKDDILHRSNFENDIRGLRGMLEDQARQIATLMDTVYGSGSQQVNGTSSCQAHKCDASDANQLNQLSEEVVTQREGGREQRTRKELTEEVRPSRPSESEFDQLKLEVESHKIDIEELMCGGLMARDDIGRRLDTLQNACRAQNEDISRLEQSMKDLEDFRTDTKACMDACVGMETFRITLDAMENSKASKEDLYAFRKDVVEQWADLAAKFQTLEVASGRHKVELVGLQDSMKVMEDSERELRVCMEDFVDAETFESATKELDNRKANREDLDALDREVAGQGVDIEELLCKGLIFRDDQATKLEKLQAASNGWKSDLEGLKCIVQDLEGLGVLEKFAEVDALQRDHREHKNDIVALKRELASLVGKRGMNPEERFQHIARFIGSLKKKISTVTKDTWVQKARLREVKEKGNHGQEGDPIPTAPTDIAPLSQETFMGSMATDREVDLDVVV